MPDVQTYTLELIETSPILRGRAVFPLTFTGFLGHFPGQPILPGFMQIEVALELLRLHQPSSSVELACIDAAKFLRAVAPNEEIIVEMIPLETSMYDVTILVQGEPAGRFQLRVTQESLTT